MYLRLAERLPRLFSLTGVLVRGAEAATAVRARWGLPAHSSLERLLEEGAPEVAITAVAADANPGIVETLVAHGVAVLSETPPAGDPQRLRLLWERTGASGLVQVAEQYLHSPVNAARAALVRSGVLGRATSVQVSSTQLHHAVSLARGLLGAGASPAVVRAVTSAAPLADPITRAGWTGSTALRPLANTIAVIDLGEGRTVLYDFTETQTRNPLRSHRMVVRGSLGELVDDRLVRLVDAATVMESVLLRRQTGQHQNLEGMHLDHISHDGEVLYRNPFAAGRLSDEEVAVASVLLATTAWARGAGAPPYPLSEGSQDALLGHAIELAAETGVPVTTAREAWAT